jgi:hypothetical protein
MKKERTIDGKNIEEEFQLHGLQAGESPPEYWRNLGSSKTRTKEQEIKGRDLILQKITETTDNTAIAFTDGSCLNNPGPCGAGAIVFVEEETTELSIASRLAVDGKPRIIDNPFLCTVFNLSRLSLFPICHTQLAYCKTEPIKLL